MGASHTFRQFVDGPMTNIQGWTGAARSVHLLEPVARSQRECAGSGVFEIGVHHGRFLIALHLLCDENARSLGLDLFEDQSKNADHSGSGDQSIAQGNIDAFLSGHGSVDLMAGDSLALQQEDKDALRKKYGAFRLVSVDGGHTREHIVADLKTASELAHPEGLIIIDDFFHPGFPGVTEGYYAIAGANQIPFIPLFVNRKKLVLCHVSYRSHFWNVMTKTARVELDAIAPAKVVRIAGHDTIYYGV